jgi:hypothetical protein
VSTAVAPEDGVAPAAGLSRRFRQLPAGALAGLAGLAWWLVGYLPWIVESLVDRAPATDGAQRAFVAVPLVASSLGGLVAGALTGGVVAGLLSLLTRPGARLRTAGLTVTGMVAAAAIALVQAARAMRADGGFDGDQRVVFGLCVVVVLSALVGWFLGSCALLGHQGLGIALATLAAVVPSWVNGLSFAVLDDPLYGHATIVGWLAQWLGAAVLAGALVVIGVRPVARLAWWPVALLLAWFIGPGLTSAGYLEVYLRPGAGLPGTLGDAVAAAWQVFGQASLPANRWLPPWIAAVVVAAAVAAVLTRPRQAATARS